VAAAAERRDRAGAGARWAAAGRLRDAGAGDDAQQTNEIASCAASYRQFLDGSFRSQEACIADYQQKGYEQIFLPGGQK